MTTFPEKLNSQSCGLHKLTIASNAKTGASILDININRNNTSLIKVSVFLHIYTIVKV